MTSLTDLLARVEAAQGPDRELDCAIFCATAASPFQSYYPDCVLASQGGFAARLEIDDIEKFTASLDAAVALMERVLPGWSWTLRSNSTAVLWSPQSDAHDREMVARCATPALALLAAILRALAQKDSADA